MLGVPFDVAELVPEHVEAEPMTTRLRGARHGVVRARPPTEAEVAIVERRSSKYKGQKK